VTHFIAEEAMTTHVRHILAKFGVHRCTQAILAALRLGMIA
jgi:DNA-binding CsgD family transcriptional regulator